MEGLLERLKLQELQADFEEDQRLLEEEGALEDFMPGTDAVVSLRRDEGLQTPKGVAVRALGRSWSSMLDKSLFPR